MIVIYRAEKGAEKSHFYSQSETREIALKKFRAFIVAKGLDPASVKFLGFKESVEKRSGFEGVRSLRL